MVISLNSLPKKVRKWYRSHIYHMYDFRILIEQEKTKAADPKEKKKIRDKQEYPRKKIEQHMVYGESLGLNSAQMREFNLAIIHEIKKGRDPKAIIRTLIKENGQK